MKPHLRKVFMSSAILTFAFAAVIFTITFAGSPDSRALAIGGSMVMALATIVAAKILGKSPSDSDNEKHDSR
jgi:hypothetical protein